MSDKIVKNNNNELDLDAINLLYNTFSNVGEGVLDLSKSKEQIEILNKENNKVNEEENIDTEVNDNIASENSINNKETTMLIEIKENKFIKKLVEFIKKLFK